MAQKLHTSHAGILFIQGWERFSATIYPDQGKRPTIGFGHLIQPGEKLQWPEPWTPAIGTMQLGFDLGITEGYINAWVCERRDLAQYQFDALAALVINIGGANFQSSHILRYLQAGDFVSAAAQFPKWDHVNGVVSDGLLRRRNAERAMFLGNQFSVTS